jgi:hypothetical protein
MAKVLSWMGESGQSESILVIVPDTRMGLHDESRSTKDKL